MISIDTAIEIASSIEEGFCDGVEIPPADLESLLEFLETVRDNPEEVGLQYITDPQDE